MFKCPPEVTFLKLLGPSIWEQWTTSPQMVLGQSQKSPYFAHKFINHRAMPLVWTVEFLSIVGVKHMNWADPENPVDPAKKFSCQQEKKIFGPEIYNIDPENCPDPEMYQISCFLKHAGLLLPKKRIQTI